MFYSTWQAFVTTVLTPVLEFALMFDRKCQDWGNKLHQTHTNPHRTRAEGCVRLVVRTSKHTCHNPLARERYSTVDLSSDDQLLISPKVTDRPQKRESVCVWQKLNERDG